MTSEFEQTLEQFGWLIGEVAVLRSAAFELRHRDDQSRGGEELERFTADAADQIARFDDARNYRPLKTAPNLRHGWRIVCTSAADAEAAVEQLYPGRLAALRAWQRDELSTTALRQTLNRQTGMYRIASRVTDAALNELVGRFCRSDGGCLRTILWKRDGSGAAPSTLLPEAKFNPAYDQTNHGERAVPLLCQEACNLLVAAARAVAKGE